MGNQVVEYNVTTAAIAEMKELYMGLVITDIDDKEQYDAVHSAHMVVKGKRIEVEKRRKELKADALEYGRRVDSKAKEIFKAIEPLESHLKAEKQKVQDEKDRLENERIAKIKGEIDSWKNAYYAMNGYDQPFGLTMAKVSDLTEYISKLETVRDLISPELYFEFTGEAIETCNSLLAMSKRDLENRIRLDKEEAERKAESERQAKVAAEQAEIAAKLKAEQDKIDEANRKIQAEKDALEAEKKAEQERKDREEFERKARAEAIEAAARKAELEALAKAEREKKRKEEAIRQESLKPDKEKLMGFAQFLAEGITYPNVEDPNAKELAQWAYNEIIEISETVLEKAKKL